MTKILVLTIMLMGAVGVANAGSQSESTVFAGDCVWEVDAVFKHVKGVSKVTSGYAGGKLVNPTYPELGYGYSGYAESVPTKPGYKNPKYIQEIYVTNINPGGYWEDQGYNWFGGS